VEFDVVAVLKDLGPALALLGYFVWKDKTFTEKILTVMAKVEHLLDRLEAREDEGEKEHAA